MTDPLNDVLGLSDDAPAAERLQRHISLKAAASGRGLEDVGGVQALRRPVTTNTLATVFGMDVQTITRRLIDCPHQTHGNRRLYDFAEAASYIVKPKMTPEQFIRTLNSAHMPAEINKVFWDGQRSRIKYMIEAQEAWETEGVHAALTGLCQVFKEGLSTLTETLRERARLDDEQANLVDEVLDDLRSQLVERMNALAEQTTTPSMIGKPLFGAPGVSPPAFDDEDEA